MRRKKAVIFNQNQLCIKTQYLKQELLVLYLQSRCNQPGLDLKENRLCLGKNMVSLC